MKILVSGAGIAGPTLAYWLKRHGHEPVIVEAAPTLRAGGHIIDFWGAGYDVADKMGLIPQLEAQGYPPRAVKLVDARGRRVGGFSAGDLEEAADGRYVSIPRAGLSAAIHDAIKDEIEIVWGDSIREIRDGRRCADVTFDRSGTRAFDLVVGADGLHSNVRRLVFGEDGAFERHLGYNVAAFEIGGYRPREPAFYVCYTLPGVEISRYDLRGDRTMFLFVFKDDPGAALPRGIEAQRAALRARFADAGWELPLILDAMEQCDAIYYDRMSQVRMSSWSKGRVALVGDSCACPTLLSGEGAPLAMAAAYVLAGELRRADGDFAQAFARYDEKLRPTILDKQENALALAASFVPDSAWAVTIRNLVTRAFFIPFVREMFLGKTLKNRIALPDYAAEEISGP